MPSRAPGQPFSGLPRGSGGPERVCSRVPSVPSACGASRVAGATARHPLGQRRLPPGCSSSKLFPAPRGLCVSTPAVQQARPHRRAPRSRSAGHRRSRGGLRCWSRASLCLRGASLVPRCRAAFPAPSHPLCWLLPERFVSNACVNWRSAEVSLCGRCLAFAGRLMHTRTSRPPPAALRVFAVRERRPGSERVSARPWASVWNEEHLAPRARPAARLGRRLFQSRRRCWLQNKDSGPLPPFLPCGSLLCL